MKLTDTPAYCASCYAQKPQLRHVDFDAAYDGPVLEGSVRVAIDDLVLCEECLKEGAELLGLVDPDATTAELERVKAKAAEQDERLLAQSAYVAQLEAAVAAKPNQPAARPRAQRAKTAA